MGNAATFYAASEPQYATIIAAIEAGNADAVRQFIRNGADINAKGSHGTALETAALWNQSPEIVDILLTAHANPNTGQGVNSLLCLVYRQLLIKSTARARFFEGKKEQYIQSIENLKKIIYSLLRGGATCAPSDYSTSKSDRKLIIKLIEPIIDKVNEPQAEAETKAAQEMFTDKNLTRPLLTDITADIIGGYLGAPANAKQQRTELQERIAAEEEKKDAAAATSQSQSKSAEKTESGAKSLDGVE
jgi:hypothetical protein